MKGNIASSQWTIFRAGKEIIRKIRRRKTEIKTNMMALPKVEYAGPNAI